MGAPDRNCVHDPLVRDQHGVEICAQSNRHSRSSHPGCALYRWHVATQALKETIDAILKPSTPQDHRQLLVIRISELVDVVTWIPMSMSREPQPGNDYARSSR